MRYKRRYFCIEVLFLDDAKKPAASAAGAGTGANQQHRHVQKLKHTVLADTIETLIERLYGDFGVATIAPSFSVIYFNTNTNVAIVRASRDAQKKFHALLTFVQRLGDFDVAVRVVHVSGSVKKSKQFLLGYCERQLASLVSATAAAAAGPAVSAESIEGFRNLTEACKTKDNSFVVHDKP